MDIDEYDKKNVTIEDCECLKETDRALLQGTKVRLPKQGGIASHALVHLRPTRSNPHGLKTIYYCGRAHSESDPPPWTTSFEKATCPDCRNRYEEKALRHKELLKGRPTRMDHPEDCAYRRGYSECDCGLDDGVSG